MVEMFDNISRQGIFGSDQDLDDFVEVEWTDFEHINDPWEHSEIKHTVQCFCSSDQGTDGI